MSTVVPYTDSRSAPRIDDTLRNVRWRSLCFGAASAVCVTLAVGIAGILCAMQVDYLTLPGNGALRPWLTAIPLTLAVGLGIWRVGKVWQRHASIVRAARDVDRATPALEERWSTLTETQDTEHDHVHPAMRRKLAYEAGKWVGHVDAREVVSHRTLVQSIVGLAACCVLLLGLFVWSPVRTSVLMQRFLSPFQEITLTRIEGLPKRLVLPKYEPAEIQATLAGSIPESAELLLRDENREERRMRLRISSDKPALVKHRLREVDQPFDFMLLAGDAQSSWIEAQVVDRPRLSDVRLTITPPAYTERDPVQRSELPHRLTVLEHSVIEIAFRTEQRIETFDLELGEESSKRLRSDEGGWYRFRKELTEDLTLTPNLTCPFGLKNKRPPTCRVVVYRDRAPSVKVVKTESVVSVRPDDTVELRFEASDDFGVERAELMVFSDDENEAEPIKVLPIDLGKLAGKKKVTGSVELPLEEFQLEDGESIRYAVRVFDNRQFPPAESTAETGRTLSLSQEDAESEDSQLPSSLAQASTNSQPNGHRDRRHSQQGNNATAEKGSFAGSIRRPAAVETGRQATTFSTEETGEPHDKRRIRFADAANPKSQQSRGGDSPASRSSSNDIIAQSDPTQSPIAVRNPHASEPEVASNGDAASGSQGNQSLNVASTSSGSSDPNDSLMANADNELSSSDPTSASRHDATSQRNTLRASSNAMRMSSNETNSTNARGNPPQEQGKVSTPDGGLVFSGEKEGETNSEESDQNSSDASAQDRGDNMTRRMLDISQSSTSQCRTIKVDQFAGTFEGQEREKLAIAIAPVLHELHELLAEAGAITDGVAHHLEADSPWSSQESKLIARAERLLERSEEIVNGLQSRTSDTPYAFIGLELKSVVDSRVSPARDSLWESHEATVDRGVLVRGAWSDIQAAIGRLSDLTKSFQRIRREHRLGEKMQKVKKLYSVYLEDALALLLPNQSGINNYERRIAEMEFDDEYLSRLQEVLEMQEEMRAELAKLMSDDPRLMQRFMNLTLTRTDTLRDQLTLLKEEQKAVAREVQAWAASTGEDREALIEAVKQVRRSMLVEIVDQADNLHERLITWLPLSLRKDATEFEEVIAKSQTIAATARKLTVSEAEEDELIAEGHELYQQIKAVDDAIRHVDVGYEHPGLAEHLLNRLVEVRRLTTLTSSWIRQMKLLASGSYSQEVSIVQYKLTTNTDRLAGKLQGLETYLAQTISTDPNVSAALAEKATTLLEILDNDLQPNQLAAAFSLSRERMPEAHQRVQAAMGAFEKAETVFDELMRAIIDELDKVPPQDPIASLLDDPTLDELLADLENEGQLREVLGIPCRPSNLRIIGDWLLPGNRANGGLGVGGNGNGGMSRMIIKQITQRAERNRRRAHATYRRAIARALKEQEAAANTSSRDQSAVGTEVMWNTLLGKLESGLMQGDDDLPPEEYRRAIEQYLSRISRFRQPIELEGGETGAP